MPLIHDIRSDLSRYGRTGEPTYYTLFLNPGFLATLTYRISQAVHRLMKRHPSALNILILMVDSLFRRLAEIVTNIYIHPEAEIGPGLYLPHAFGIVIGPTVVGRNCDIYQDVTIGQGLPWGQGNRPIIGDRVYLGPGAKLFGKLTIGNDASIGANAVVARSVPDRGVIYCASARLASRKGSFALVAYPQMENDPERIQSMLLADQEQCAGLEPPVNDSQSAGIEQPANGSQGDGSLSDPQREQIRAYVRAYLSELGIPIPDRRDEHPAT